MPPSSTRPPDGGELGLAGIEPALEARLLELFAEGQELWERFRRRKGGTWHSFQPADYPPVVRCLLAERRRGTERFLELGSATGVVTIAARLLGYEACGIEIDPQLVAEARALAARFTAAVRFAAGSYLPEGYSWRSDSGDRRLGTIGLAEPAYPALGRELSDFDLIYVYPWPGEEPILQDVVARHGRPGARLMVHDYVAGIRVYQDGRTAG